MGGILERIESPRYNESTKITLGVDSGNPAEPSVDVEDPAALLLRSKDLIWLAVVQIVDIKQNEVRVEKLPTRLLPEPNIRIAVRIMRLVSRANSGEDGDWEWTGKCESVTHEVEGRWIQLLDPAVVQHSPLGNDITPTYAFHSSEGCYCFTSVRKFAGRL